MISAAVLGIGLLLADALAAGVLQFQRITHVTPPCSVQRAENSTWLPLQPRETLNWDLWPGDHVVCKAHGKITVRTGLTTHDYTDYVAQTATLGILGGRWNGAFPYLTAGSGLASKRLWGLGSLAAKDPLPGHGLPVSRSEAEALERYRNSLDVRPFVPLERIPGAGTIDPLVTRIPPGYVTIGERAFGEAGDFIHDVHGEAGVAVLVLGGLVWLFAAKQWIWLAVMALAVAAFLIIGKRL